MYSHHNAVGMGLADAIPERFWEEVDLDMTYPNVITSKVTLPVKIPVILKNDLEAIQFCIRTCTGIEQEKVRVIRIPNTLSLERIMISESMLEEARNTEGITVEGEPYNLEFDQEGNLSL